MARPSVNMKWQASRLSFGNLYRRARCSQLSITRLATGIRRVADRSMHIQPECSQPDRCKTVSIDEGTTLPIRAVLPLREMGRPRTASQLPQVLPFRIDDDARWSGTPISRQDTRRISRKVCRPCCDRGKCDRTLHRPEKHQHENNAFLDSRSRQDRRAGIGNGPA